MRFLYSFSLLLLVSACDFSGGAMPIDDAKKFLNSMSGPKVDSVEDTQIQAAKNAELKGNYQLAIETYQIVLEKDGDNQDIILALAEAFRRNAEYEKAISAYDDLLKRNPSNIVAKEGKALALLSKGDFETPTPIFEDVLKTDNTRWKSLNGIGILFVTRGLNEDGQRYFEAALKQSPNNISVLNNLGLVLSLNKKFDKSIETLSQASSISAVDSPQRKRIDLNLALVYASSGKLEDAQKLAEQYLKGPQLNNNLGLYAHLAKDDKLAKSYLNMALSDSKTYYDKAWDNLEVLDTERKEENPSQRSKTVIIPSPGKDTKPQDAETSHTNEKQPEKNIASDDKKTDKDDSSHKKGKSSAVESNKKKADSQISSDEEDKKSKTDGKKSTKKTGFLSVPTTKTDNEKPKEKGIKVEKERAKPAPVEPVPSSDLPPPTTEQPEKSTEIDRQPADSRKQQ